MDSNGQDPVSQAERREQQRFKHLVLDRPRPKTAGPKNGRQRAPAGSRRRKTVKIAVARLEPGIEEAVQQKERWSHKREGTPQTHDHVSRYREGAMKRLYRSEAIDAAQLQAATAIAEAVERIGSDVTVKTASLETRIQSSRYGDAFYERLALVRLEVSYTAWRSAARAATAMLLAVIAQDMPLTQAALHYRMPYRRCRSLLIAALDDWLRIHSATCKELDDATLTAAHAGILS